MSKAVKAVGRAVSSVVTGAVKVVQAVVAPVVNVVKEVAKPVVQVVQAVAKPIVQAVAAVAKPVIEAVKSVASSKLGKVVLTAAAVYFGGAALAGGLGTMGTSTSFLSGMGTGVANAASSLSSAWSATMAGNFSQAGSALASGIQGQTAGGLVAGVNAATPAIGGAVAQNGVGAFTGATATGLPTVAADAANVLAPTAKAATDAAGAASGGLSPIGQYGLITGGMQLAGGVISGIGQQKALEDQRSYEQQLAQQSRDRYTSSVDDYLAQATERAARNAKEQTPYTGNGTSSLNYDPVAEARSISERQRQQMEQYYQQQPTGLVARGMQYTQPTTNNNFPTYNPYYFRG